MAEPVKVIEQTRIYPLGQEASAKPMQFPNASNVPVNMLYPTDGSAFQMLSRFIDTSTSMRPGSAAIVAAPVVKGKPLKPDAKTAKVLDQAARTAANMGHAIAYQPQTIVPNGAWYEDRRWLNVFPGNATFTADTFNYIDPRTGFFTFAYSASAGIEDDELAAERKQGAARRLQRFETRCRNRLVRSCCGSPSTRSG